MTQRIVSFSNGYQKAVPIIHTMHCTLMWVDFFFFFSFCKDLYFDSQKSVYTKFRGSVEVIYNRKEISRKLKQNGWVASQRGWYLCFLSICLSHWWHILTYQIQWSHKKDMSCSLGWRGGGCYWSYFRLGKGAIGETRVTKNEENPSSFQIFLNIFLDKASQHFIIL